MVTSIDRAAKTITFSPKDTITMNDDDFGGKPWEKNDPYHYRWRMMVDLVREAAYDACGIGGDFSHAAEHVVDRIREALLGEEEELSDDAAEPSSGKATISSAADIVKNIWSGSGHKVTGVSRDFDPVRLSGMSMSSYSPVKDDPDTMPIAIEFNGKTVYDVGRYGGNVPKMGSVEKVKEYMTTGAAAGSAVVALCPEDFALMVDYVRGKATVAVNSGHSCKKCNEFNDYADSNQPDGSYVCYRCR